MELGVDVILGVARLHELGKVMFNWEEMAICFGGKEEAVKLRCRTPKSRGSEHEQEMSIAATNKARPRLVIKREGSKKS
jgi:hypothetical protein